MSEEIPMLLVPHYRNYFIRRIELIGSDNVVRFLEVMSTIIDGAEIKRGEKFGRERLARDIGLNRVGNEKDSLHNIMIGILAEINVSKITGLPVNMYVYDTMKDYKDFKLTDHGGVFMDSKGAMGFNDSGDRWRSASDIASKLHSESDGYFFSVVDTYVEGIQAVVNLVGVCTKTRLSNISDNPFYDKMGSPVKFLELYNSTANKISGEGMLKAMDEL